MKDVILIGAKLTSVNAEGIHICTADLNVHSLAKSETNKNQKHEKNKSNQETLKSEKKTIFNLS
jgi:copper homeostasis protein CutC